MRNILRTVRFLLLAYQSGKLQRRSPWKVANRDGLALTEGTARWNYGWVDGDYGSRTTSYEPGR